jgi:hypothetical protein
MLSLTRSVLKLELNSTEISMAPVQEYMEDNLYFKNS